MGRLAETVAEMRAAATAALEAGGDAIKVVSSGGLLTAESDPARAQYSSQALAEVVEVARTNGIKVVAHATAADAIVSSAEAGIDAIDHGNWYSAECQDGWTDDDGRRVVRTGGTIGVTVAGRLRSLLDRPDAEALLGEQLRHHRRFAELGGRLSIHTDAGASLTPFGGIAGSLRAAALGLGRTPLEMLRMATSEAAQHLGLATQVGRVASGYRADLVVLGGNPAADLRNLERIELVFRAGKAVAGPASAGLHTIRRAVY
jgi:imidazolonepropionase-like amidohydrolase